MQKGKKGNSFNTMGWGYTVHCKRCGYEVNVYDGFGGVCDSYTFQCFDCKEYFYVQRPHSDDSEELRQVMKMDNIVKSFHHGLDILCRYYPCQADNVCCTQCGGKNIRNISFRMPICEDEREQLKNPCPKCGAVLEVDDLPFFFDD